MSKTKFQKKKTHQKICTDVRGGLQAPYKRTVAKDQKREKKKKKNSQQQQPKNTDREGGTRRPKVNDAPLFQWGAQGRVGNDSPTGRIGGKKETVPAKESQYVGKALHGAPSQHSTKNFQPKKPGQKGRRPK